MANIELPIFAQVCYHFIYPPLQDRCRKLKEEANAERSGAIEHLNLFEGDNFEDEEDYKVTQSWWNGHAIVNSSHGHHTIRRLQRVTFRLMEFVFTHLYM